MAEQFKRASRVVIIFVFAAVMVYDLFAQIFGGTNSTISRAIWDLSSEVPFIPFLAGFFCGHLWWGNPDKLRS